MTSKRGEKSEKATKWKTIDSFFNKPVSTETKDSSEEPISQQSLPESDSIDHDSENATESVSSSSVSTVTSKANTPPYPDLSSLHDSNLQMTEIKMQLLTSNWKDVNNFDFPVRYVDFNSSKSLLVCQ